MNLFILVLLRRIPEHTQGRPHHGRWAEETRVVRTRRRQPMGRDCPFPSRASELRIRNDKCNSTCGGSSASAGAAFAAGIHLRRLLRVFSLGCRRRMPGPRRLVADTAMTQTLIRERSTARRKSSGAGGRKGDETSISRQARRQGQVVQESVIQHAFKFQSFTSTA
jgi:hypothetical protein